MQGSVTWEGTNRSEHGQQGCARGDGFGDRQRNGHTGGSAGTGLNRKGTIPGAHQAVLELL